MGEDRSRKKQRSPRSSQGVRGPFITRHPLSEASLEVRRQYVVALGEAHRATFAKVLPQLMDLIQSIDPLHALTVVSTYGLTISTTRIRKDNPKTSLERRIQQGHVELLQALFLRNQWTREQQCAAPAEIQRIFDVMPDLFEAFQGMRHPTAIAAAEEDLDDRHTSAAKAVQEFIRAHTSVVRNWGFFRTVVKTSRGIFAALDTDFSAVFGLGLTQLVDVFEHLIRRYEDRVSDHSRRVFAIFRAGLPSKMMDELFLQFPMACGGEELRAALQAPEVTIKQAQAALLPFLDRFLPLSLVITPDEIAADLGLPPKALREIFTQLSLGFGSLADTPPERLFLDNPVWTRPLIDVGDDSFFCPLPQTLMSFIFPIVENLLRPHLRLRERLQKARAEYLENQTENHLRQAFPGCSLVRGFTWREEDRVYESDILLRYDSTLLLVEAKSGAVSWPALRGAPERIVQHIKDLIVAPSEQSARLARRLQQEIYGSTTEAYPLNLPIALDGITSVMRLSVTLHDFATIQSVPKMLVDAGLIKTEHQLAPCIALADLEAVLDILDRPYLRLHYLRRRAELLLSTEILGDELDLLGLYLDTGFNLGTTEVEDIQVVTVGYSQRVDRYFTLLDEDVQTSKPKPNITPWIRQLCDQLSVRAHPGWFEIAVGLLSMSIEEQRNVERRVRSLARMMRNGKQPKNGLDAVVLVPPPHRTLAVVFQVRAPMDKTPFRVQASSLASQAFDAPHVNACVVIAIPANDDQLKFVGVGILYASEREFQKCTFL